MSEVTSYSQGEFCWTDLGTPDVAAAKKFYQGLFGWKTDDRPMGMGDAKYSLLQVQGRDACALYPQMDEMKKTKVPPFWLAYIAVDNVDEIAKKIKAAGGKVIQEPMDVFESGRMAMAQDPTGAGFAIWQAGQHIGAGIDEAPGTVCWRELYTPNIDAAAKFYTRVFGWSPGEVWDMGGMKYHMFNLGKDGVCGMMPPPDKKIPPMWLTYFVVQNCDQTEAKAKQLGGQVMKSSEDIPGMGRFAILGDPHGATFGVFQPLSR